MNGLPIIRNMGYSPFDSRNHCLVFYGTESALQLSLTAHHNRILHYAYILHDADNAEPHFHIALHLNNTVNSDNVISWFKEYNGGQNVMDQDEGSKEAFFNYLTHSEHDDKVLYSMSDIVTDDMNYFLDKNSTAYNIVQDLRADAPLLYMAQTYGRDFILNHRKYREFADALIQDERRRDYANYEKQLPYDG